MLTVETGKVPVEIEVLERLCRGADEVLQDDGVGLGGQAGGEGVQLVAETLLEEPCNEDFAIEISAECQRRETCAVIAALGGVVDCAVPAVPRYTSEGTALERREREEDGGEVVERVEATVLQRKLGRACKALREEGREIVVYGEKGRVDVFDV